MSMQTPPDPADLPYDWILVHHAMSGDPIMLRTSSVVAVIAAHAVASKDLRVRSILLVEGGKEIPVSEPPDGIQQIMGVPGMRMLPQPDDDADDEDDDGPIQFVTAN